MPGKEIERYVTHEDIDLMARIAKSYALSGFFDDIRGEVQAYVKVSAGRELGLQPFEAMNSIDIIKGKPVVNANFMASKVKASGKYDYRVVEMTNARCELVFLQRVAEEWEPIGTSDFDMDDAKSAELLNSQMYRKYPRNMLFARALSNGVAWFCPDVVSSRLYVEGEIPEEERAPLAAPQVMPAGPRETTIDVEPEPAEDPLEGTAVQPPMAGVATIDEPTEKPKRKRRTRAEIEADQAAIEQKTADGIRITQTTEGSDTTEPLTTERTAAEILADRKDSGKTQAEPPAAQDRPDTPAAQPLTQSQIMDEQADAIRQIGILIAHGLSTEQRSHAREALEYLDMWGKDTPKDLWMLFGKKALTWKTLEPCLQEAYATKLEREQAETNAAAGPEVTIDVEPEPESAPWDNDPGSEQ